MKRGARGRGGRGRGGFSRRPTPLRPTETFTYNPNCEVKPSLTLEDKRLIVYNRFLKRSWNESECFVSTASSQRVLESYYDQFEVDIRDPVTQKKAIVECIGPEYFPSELLAKTLLRIKQKLGDSKKAFSWAELEKQEKSGGGGEEGAQDTDDEEGGGGSSDGGAGDDFGGEDYQADYDLEDADDDFAQDNGGNEGGDY